MIPVQTFYLEGYGSIPRGEALRCLIAAIYNTAKALQTFTTDDVYLRVDGYQADALRKATANSKLIAVALRKCEKMGYVRKCGHGAADAFLTGDQLCHSRTKRVWHKGAHFSS